MANPQPAARPTRIPRYVQRLNDFGESHGIAVETMVAPYDDDPERSFGLRLWSHWRTTRTQFMSLGLLSRGQHIPSKRGTVSIPGWHYQEHRRALMIGTMTSSGDDVLWEIDWGPGEFAIADAGDVEIVTSSGETLYHGTAEALVAQGIEKARLPLHKRPSASSSYDSEERRWWSRRQMDDTIVYRVESQSAHLERQAERRRFEEEMRRERSGTYLSQPVPDDPQPRVDRTWPAYLRLVVDNTRT